MTRKTLLSLIVLVLMSSRFSWADEISVIKEKIKREFAAIPVEEVRPIHKNSTLYEIITKGNVIYYDKASSNLLIGYLINTDGENITQKRINEIKKSLLTNLSAYTKYAVLVKEGNGEPVYVISDPDCPFCARVLDYLKNKTNPVYMFFYPLDSIHPNARQKSAYLIETMRSKKKSYYDIDVSDISKLKTSGEGEQILEKHIELGQKIKIDGVPVVIVKNERIDGANIPAIENLLKD